MTEQQTVKRELLLPVMDNKGQQNTTELKKIFGDLILYSDSRYDSKKTDSNRNCCQFSFLVLETERVGGAGFSA